MSPRNTDTDTNLRNDGKAAEDIRDDGALEEEATPAGSDQTFIAIDWTAHTRDADEIAGAEIIQTMVKLLPNAPGVYRMMNAAGEVLYIGKARSLKKRVTNYAQRRFHTNRIGKMVHETATMEFVVTRTEIEALLLEANLIKRMRPRFNVLMKDDKSFPYIMLTSDHTAPGIYKHRGVRSRRGGDYFGPFASAQAVGRTINSLQQAFLLRSCTDSFFDNRTRPCLLFQIKRCAGPCTGEISREGYGKLVQAAKDFLSGRSQKVKTEISSQMHQAAEDLDFERAAVYRDRLAALSHVQSHQDINPQTIDEADVFAIYQEGGQTCIQVFFFRTGQNWGNRAYFPKADQSLKAAEVLGSFLAQFYDYKASPHVILLSHQVKEQEFLAEVLSTRAGHKVVILVPQRGEKKDIVDHANRNARAALGRRLAETSIQAQLLEGFSQAFGLEKPPVRIEVYDNSHIMGTNAVGSMIVAGPEGFIKNQYRKFNIRSTDITPGDDFGMMREVMTRRFSRLLKEYSADQSYYAESIEDVGVFPAWPDVILIDGGQGQMTAVHAILAELGVEDRVAAIGVAKGQNRKAGRERFFVRGKDSFLLPVCSPVLFFIQRLRDEAHRCAIGSHRVLRKKGMMKNPLDTIAGIGPLRKRALLLAFGTAKAISQAAVEDLMTVEGIAESTANLVYNHFHDDGR